MHAPVVNTERLYKIQDALKDDYSDLFLCVACIGFACFLFFKYETKTKSRKV